MSKTENKLLCAAGLMAAVFAAWINYSPAIAQQAPGRSTHSSFVQRPKLAEIESKPIREVLTNARQQLKTTTSYSQKYYSMSYPNGDVPISTGACTDVVIRSFRAAGVDLQQEVHLDMKQNFNKYPSKWGLNRTDTNIDHRRVLNLQTFFRRNEKSIPVTYVGSDYKPGDIVSWDLNGKGLTHIGIVSNIWNVQKRRYLIIHNIGAGAQLEDRLFEWKITGHYRYF